MMKRALVAMLLPFGMPASARGDVALPPIAAALQPAATSVQAALAAFTRRQEAAIGGRIGVAFRMVETGEAGAVHGDERFPMASTFKVAIAGTLLARVDRGELVLDRMVPVTQADMDETGEVADHLIHPGVTLSLANLIELMLTQSNNTATDKVLALAGGPAAVTRWLQAAGVRDQRVDRNVNALLDDFEGFPPNTSFNKEYERRFSTPEAQRREDEARTPNLAFEADPRDTSTPSAMVDLLAKLLTGTLLKEPSRAFLLAVMTRCETGANRLKGMLPEGTVVAHKTGTVGGTVNDVGMITLPEGRGHLLIAVFTKSSAHPEAEREHAIAEIGRSAFDYFSMR